MQRGGDSASHTPEQLPATPLPLGLAGSPQGSAVTPEASPQAPGPSLAAALARAAAENSPASHHSASSAVARNSPTRTAASPALASGPAGFTGSHSKTGLRAVTDATQQATTAAGVSAAEVPSLLVATGKPAAVSRQEEASSSASFDSWRSTNHRDIATTAATARSPAATATAAASSRQYGSHPAAAAAADAQGIAVNTLLKWVPRTKFSER